MPDDPQMPRRSGTARLVLERRDGPNGRGFAYAVESNDSRPIVIATSSTFYPEVDLAAADRALQELIARLERAGWQQQRTDPYTIIGMRFRRDEPARTADLI